VNHLSKEEREKISAMVNLDSVGTSSTKIETDRGSATLLNALAAVAGTFKLPLQIVNVHLVGMSDSDAFQDKKIPAINIHSVTRETFPFLHSKQDQLEAIHLSEYYDTYRLVTAYLAYLDEILDPPTAVGQATGSH
jgi:Zn-dependent M28 family amino/carboxypeptidase